MTEQYIDAHMSTTLRGSPFCFGFNGSARRCRRIRCTYLQSFPVLHAIDILSNDRIGEVYHLMKEDRQGQLGNSGGSVCHHVGRIETIRNGNSLVFARSSRSLSEFRHTIFNEVSRGPIEPYF